MSRAAAVLLLLLLPCASGCTSVARAPSPDPAQDDHRNSAWTPISLGEVPDPALRQTLQDLLAIAGNDILWPGFARDDRPLIIVDTRDAHPVAYCLGACEPMMIDGAGSARVWRQITRKHVSARAIHVAPRHEWSLNGDEPIMAMTFIGHRATVTIAVHELFHTHYQSWYAMTFGEDTIDGTSGPYRVTRDGLENDYGRTPSVVSALHRECAALAAALRHSPVSPTNAIASLREFVSIRAARRTDARAPAAEEDYWERQEGVAVNLERRTARHFGFDDPSLVGSAVHGNGCSMLPDVSYLLVLGGLQAAVLDTFGPPDWPDRVYPTDRTHATSLYRLVAALTSESE